LGGDKSPKEKGFKTGKRKYDEWMNVIEEMYPEHRIRLQEQERRRMRAFQRIVFGFGFDLMSRDYQIKKPL